MKTSRTDQPLARPPRKDGYHGEANAADPARTEHAGFSPALGPREGEEDDAENRAEQKPACRNHRNEKPGMTIAIRRRPQRRPVHEPRS